MSIDYELELKIRNAPLLAMMRASGYETAAQLSRACDVTQSVIGLILNLNVPLYTEHKNGVITVRPSIKKIANHLCCTPEEIYPEAHWYDGLAKNTFTAQVSAGCVGMLAHKSTGDPAAFLEYLEDEGEISFESIFGGLLTDREAAILKARFEERATLLEAGKRFGLSPERTRQVEAKALRKLRIVEFNDGSDRLRGYLRAMGER